MIPLNWSDGGLCVRLALALGHFLWQGTLIAVLAWLAVIALRRASAQARYGVLVVAMGVMALCVPATFMLVDARSSQGVNDGPARSGAESLPANTAVTSSGLSPTALADGMNEQAIALTTGDPAGESPRELALGSMSESDAAWQRIAVFVAIGYFLQLKV